MIPNPKFTKNVSLFEIRKVWRRSIK